MLNVADRVEGTDTQGFSQVRRIRAYLRKARELVLAAGPSPMWLFLVTGASEVTVSHGYMDTRYGNV
jgi:hypothetical protein